MEVVKLLEQLDQTSFSEGVLLRSLEGQGRSELLQIFNPLLSDTGRHQITLVENEYQMFSRAVPLEMLFQGLSSSAVGVTSIDGVNDNI